MFLKYLSEIWTALAPATGNHIWQSTLFAIAAGLLILALRKNRARARYWLWLGASLKFLVPFSLLVVMGSYLPWSRGSAGAKAGLSFVMKQVGQPFMLSTMPIVSPATPSAVLTSLIHLLPALPAVWLCGFLMVVFVWLLRWQRISAAIREATPLREGREVEALRRLEHIAGMPQPIEMLLSRSSLEPGIFGIARPVLVWPDGISERLTDSHLEAILAHELCHVRRRDNLAAAIHMVVEAIFWFHPLVWWLGTRLMEERERACDEAVLESGTDKQVYAESILKICEFCVGSPLAFVSGVTGADLKKRIARIMTSHFSRNLEFSKKLLLGAAVLIAVIVPLAYGVLNPTPIRAQSQAQNTGAITPAYKDVSIKSDESATAALKTGKGIIMQRMMIKPGEFTSSGNTLQEVIRLAYGVQDYQISGAPAWLNSEIYNVEAKAEQSVIDELQKLGSDQRELENRRMIQTLLEDRLHFKVHHETREMPIYSLVVASAGKLHEAQGNCPPNSGPVLIPMPKEGKLSALPLTCGVFHRSYPRPGHLSGQKVSLTQLTAELSQLTGRMVLDKVSFAGKYDINLDWTPEPGQSWTSPAAPNPSLSTAIQEQLGLKLESQTGPIDMLVIDHVEKPSGN